LEGEPGEVRRLTYASFMRVQRFANALKALGISKGDRVAVYMGMTPELAIACWRARGSARSFCHLRWLCRQRHRRPRQRLKLCRHSHQTRATAAATKSSSSAPSTKP